MDEEFFRPNPQRLAPSEEEKRKGVSATDVAAILGVSPFRTPLDVWLRKTDPDYVQPDISHKPAVQAGIRLENTVLSWFEDEYDTEVKDRQVMFRMSYSKGPDIYATVDGTSDYAIVEAKTTVSQSPWTEVPEHYQLQVMWQQAATGLTTKPAIVAVLHGGLHFRTYELEFDKDRFVEIRDEVCDWWAAYVDGNVAPDPSASSDMGAVGFRLKVGKGIQIDDSNELSRLVADYQEKRARREELEEEEAVLKAKIVSRFDDGAGVLSTADGVRLATASQYEKRTFNVKKLADMYPEIHANEALWKTTEVKSFKIAKS